MRRPLAYLPAWIAAVALQHPGSAGAEEARTLFGRPIAERVPLSPAEIDARRQALRDHVEDNGWVVAGDVIAPAERFAATPPPGLQADTWDDPPHRHTVYLNFFGGDMSSGTNSALMQSGCITGKVKYPGYAGSEMKALAVIQIFTSKLEPFGVRVAYDEAPPPELPYSMVMMGGSPEDVGMDPGTLGVSCSSDCGDQWWRDTTLAFTEAAFSTNTLAFTALQEASHAFGLDHIEGTSHIMYPYDSPGDHNWADGCVKYDPATGPIGCTYIHDIWCGDGAQDDTSELYAYFGANSPDVVPPTVTILTPEDGLELDAGGSFNVTAEVSDDHEGFGWKATFYKDDMLIDESFAFKGETAWGLSNLPAGTYKVRVQAIDHDRNIGADEITVYVGAAAPTTDGGTETSTGSASDTDPATTGATGTSAGDDAGTTTGVDDDKGCACGAGTRPSQAVVLGSLLLLVGARRRRPRIA